MLRLFLLQLHAVNPIAYHVLKEAAILRHKAFNIAVEGGDGDLKGTWHETAFDYLYPK